MMGMTHVFVGTASALLVSMPSGFMECLPALIGGAVGGIICDIDIRSNKYCKDALYARIAVIVIVFVCLIIDALLKNGIIASYIKNVICSALGTGLFVTLCVIGAFQKHRGFTHSILALVMFSLAVYISCMEILLPFVVGYASHLIFDILNKKRIRLFFPKGKGMCLNLCYANGITNSILLVMGISGTTFVVIKSLFV